MAFWLHLAASRQPDAVALEGRERSLTYTELSAAALSALCRLRELALPAGAPVALALADPLEFVIALHGCLLAGHPAVPIDLRLSEAEQAERTARTATVIREPLHGTSMGMSGTGADDPVVAIMHTSGTTAEPKPIELSQANFQASALGSAVALGLDPAERWLCPMPLTHVGGLSIPIRSAIYATTAVLPGPFNTERVLGELMDPSRRITLVSLVPTMLARLLDAGLHNPPSLRWALLGGGPIPPGLLARANEQRVPVAPTYGMTEACSQIATFGFPLPGVEVGIWGGEVVVRGPIVAKNALDENGWLRTGDLGEFDDRGRLRIVGRRSDTIVTGGENVAPAEVEAVLLEHPDVVDAAVHGRPDPTWGEAVVATVVLRHGVRADPDRLREFVAARIARHKVPKTVSFAERLPRTASGKLLRRQL